MTKQQYNKKYLASIADMIFIFFFLNTLLLIIHNGYLYCYLSNGRKCQICSIKTDFCDFENELGSSMMITEFLKNYQMKLHPYLSKLFYGSKLSMCCCS